MLRKTHDVQIKADGEAGEFTALASVFGNVDLVGDRIKPGAFTKTLRRWREMGDPIPIILSHQWDDPHAHIGVADPKDVKQTADGLVVKGHLDITENAVARQVYKLMKRRSLKAFSFGYSVPEGGEKIADDGANEITEVDLVEIGPTLKGANPEAQLQAVKSALVEANDDLEVSDSVSTGGGESSAEVDDGKDDEPPAKSPQDPLRRATDRVRIDIALGR